MLKLAWQRQSYNIMLLTITIIQSITLICLLKDAYMNNKTFIDCMYASALGDVVHQINDKHLIMKGL